ncbi:conserved membrane hypothetical protein [Candidatus Desulfosporosinus infrequens]|uniref:ABC transporter permease n=1 Tax=Candidatus Desulfosporosinus infrequens TaxID=2043169 RepID=A0A2U3KUG5_9FIRM|nr:conserved membrane hypothetical protein [Candidatus Desulfosporosinus infrequens]
MIVNPVLAKELRDRVRTWRSPFIMTIYSLALAGIGGLNYYFQTMYSFGGTQALRLGLMTFAFLAVVQLILIGFLAPGMTASIISGERERQTWALLLVTRLSPLSIVVGKLLSAISYIVLLILVSTPIYSTVFLFGAVDMRNLLLIVLVSLATTVTLASIGLFCSALFKRTITAIIISYLLTFFLFAGTLISAGVIQSLDREKWSRLNQAPPTPFIVNFNPLVALGSALPEGVEVVPFSRTVVRSTAVLTINGQTMSTQVKPVEPRPVWQVNLMLDALISLVCLGLTVWLIRPLRAGNKKGG